MYSKKGVSRMKQVIVTDKAPAAIGPFAAGWRAGDYVYVSGQGPLDPSTGKVVGADVGEQTTQTFKNIKAVLEAGGASLADVVKVNVYLTDMANFAGMNAAYKEFFAEPYPARATVGASLALQGMLVEIEAIAYVGS